MTTKVAGTRQVLVLCGSPRRDGNSAMLAAAFAEGAAAAGHAVRVETLDDHIRAFLRDCRQCRKPDGSCSIVDGYGALFGELFLPAHAVAFATPVYWYGMSAQTKAFFDRTFCYYAASHPQSEAHIRGMMHKRLALLLASEETYPGASLGLVHQVQEYARYTHSELVGVIQGYGNKRGEIRRDPRDPLHMARSLGERIFECKYSDYRLDTSRSGAVWDTPG